MTDHISAHAVAQFLQSNPDFFVEHAELFATLEVPHPHQSRAISLGERQILTLRERLKDFEFRLASLMRNAALNEVTSEKMTTWCARLLVEPDATKLPGAILTGLAEQYNLPDLTMRVWGLMLPEDGVAEPVSDEIKSFAKDMRTPYCGDKTEFAAAAWLKSKPASMAILPLRKHANASAFGLLVMGSDDPLRFAPDLGTSFLGSVSLLCGAALSRLLPPDGDD